MSNITGKRRTKFYTNEEGNTLYERFNQTLKNAQYFDSLVGYFRTSGFHRLYKSLENVDKIRILVGLSIDKQTYDIIEESQLNFDFESQADIKRQYRKEVQKEFENSEDTEEIAIGVDKFREMLANGKIEMRACRDRNIHAKVYITRYNADMPLYGSVVTGSSNFTENGLNAQYEFNVELKDENDVEEALERFEALWEKAVPISEDYINALETKTWMNDEITPYEIYLKFLYEYFYDEINIEEVFDERDLPDNYLKLDYQMNAVAKINKIVNEYNGAFISDVVGLGKTYIAAMYAKILRGKILVIAPPPIISNWRDVFKDFDIRTKNYDIVSCGLLRKIAAGLETVEKAGGRTYDYVFIDEAHRFRNGKTDEYEALKRICLNKKVLLITATPLNNTFYDFLSLISLFQNPTNSDIPEISDLDGFFAGRKSRIKTIEDKYGKKSKEYIGIIKDVSKEVRDKILKYLMIRRTRTDIKKYFSRDMEAQGLFFPEVQPPQEIIYEFDKFTNDIFEKTIRIIGTKEAREEEKLTYARYAPKTYLKNRQLSAFENRQQVNNAGFMRTCLVKRLESSKYAFEKTLSRAILSYEEILKMYNAGTVYISRDINVLDYMDDDAKTVEDLLEKGKDKDLECFASSEFNDDFVKDLNKDLAFLKELLNDWRSIKHDYKQEKFIDELAKNPLLTGKKLVIFTESAETGENLSAELQKIYGDKVLFYSSTQSSSLKDKIKQNYDPNQSKSDWKDNIQFLITTDILSEGINLHRSNIVINYDLPWNPTRVMQRVGRVNRVGTEHDKIYIFNFFPTSETDKQLGLKDSIISKTQAFHDALGGDYKYLSEAEEVESYNLRGEELYNTLNSNFEDEEESPELKYLSFLRNIRDNETELYSKIAKLPKKIRTARGYNNIPQDKLITFFRKGNLRKFCITDGVCSREIPFDEAIKFFECEPNEQKRKLPEKYFDYVIKNIQLFISPDNEEVYIPQYRSDTNKIILMLKGLLNSPRYTRDEKIYLQSVISAFMAKCIPDSIAKKLKKFFSREIDDIKLLADIRKSVPELYLCQNTNNPGISAEQPSLRGANVSHAANREIILSEYMEVTSD